MILKVSAKKDDIGQAIQGFFREVNNDSNIIVKSGFFTKSN
jgi:hypothetical protein